MGDLSAYLIPLVFIVGGLAALVFGADVLVRGASALAAKFGVSPFIIGLTVVAFGTSAPELVVGVRAAADGSGGLVYGNVLGSNVANIGLILGVSALLAPLPISPGVRREVGVMVGATALIAGLMLVERVVGDAEGAGGVSVLSRVDGLIILGVFALYLLDHFRRGRQGKDELSEELAHEAEARSKPPLAEGRPGWVVTLIEVAMVLGGLAFLIGGGEVVVRNAVTVAERMGVEDRVIGVTIVAIGTSLPELAASLMAAYRKHPEMILGNVLGSNIFNLMQILGVSALVSPLVAPEKTVTLDLPVAGLFTLLCAAALVTGKRMTRWEGGAFILIYAGYLVAVYFLTGPAGAAA